ncbi:MAG: hypothetical protein FWG66_00635 [Spirochaetes bacterium]|nr:hypothetical protein [Spirochaetota bacterium]
MRQAAGKIQILLIFSIVIGLLPQPVGAQVISGPVHPTNFQAVQHPAAESTSPQWARDFRRWNIVAFGTFPFSLLVSTIAMDTYRWSVHGNMGFDAYSRQFAPWPIRTAGAELMNNRQREMTFVYAASLSAALAFVDLFIVQSRRRAEQRRLEGLPAGNIIITIEPIGGEPEAGEAEPLGMEPDSPQPQLSEP